MKIIAEFETCDRIPSFLDVEFKNGKIESIAWEEDSINTKDNKFEVDDAYFLGDIADDANYETEFIYENVKSILDDFDNNIVFSKVIFSDDAGTIEATFVENEDNPMKKNAILTPYWEKANNTEIKTEDKKNAEYNKAFNNSNDILNDDLKSILNDNINNDTNDNSNNNINGFNNNSEKIYKQNMELQDIYNNNYFVDGQEYICLKTIDSLSSSSTKEELLNRIKTKDLDLTKKHTASKDEFDR